MRPGLLIGVAAAVFLGAAAFAQAPAPPVRSSAYAGSAACQSCHEPQYGSWKSTLHVQMTRPIAEATVTGDFRPGAKL
jgi:cytochrome c554/c'-like protein